MSRSNVRGPNSALTEFLRSRGISIPNNRGRARQAQARARGQASSASPPEQPASPVPEQEGGEEEEGEASVPAAGPSNQEQLDAAVAQELSAALEQERPRKATKAVSARSKKRKKDEEDEAYDPENEPDYGRSGFTRKNRPAAGQIDFCADCNCRFTVTVYNKATEDGLLCSACGSTDADGKAAAAAKKPRPAAKKKRAKAVLDGEVDRIPKLQDMAIKCIARHIEDVEALGDIGQVNMDKICQIISRNRSLTNDTVQLFLDASQTQLALYDCAKINPQRLTQIAQMCPHLVELRLHMVGQITDAVLDFYGGHLRNLTSLALRGCFLVTLAGWRTFFENTNTRLKVLEISDSSRFAAETADALVQHCPNLKHLTLSKITHLDNLGIAHLGRLQNLTKLDISHAGGLVNDETIIELLASVGANLVELNLSALRDLTDLTLTEGILKHCTNLQQLSLNDIDLLTDEGVCNFFQDWSSNPPLKSLELERCTHIQDKALDAIVAHSGATLKHLNLNSLDEMTNEGLQRMTLTNALPLCETLDLSFVRAVDDLILRRLLENAKSLKKVLVWGNNRITECEVSSTCLIVGREYL